MTPLAAWTLRRAWLFFGGLLTLVIVFCRGSDQFAVDQQAVLHRGLQYLLHS
jgi:hypothetical protein